MLNVSRPSCVWSILFCLFATLAAGSAAQGQTAEPSALDHQLDRVDFGVSGVGIFNHSSSGPVINNTQPGQSLVLDPSNTLGALVTLRYVIKPLVGFELNYGYSRYSQTFYQSNGGIVGVQNNANQYTAGYVAHARQIFGVTPFVVGGAGVTAFRPDIRRRRGPPRASPRHLLLLCRRRDHLRFPALRRSRAVPAGLLPRA